MRNVLDQIKSQKWFYEFQLPDGTVTESYLSEFARQVHLTREKALRKYLEERRGSFKDSLDISCHEGYFSHVLSDYISSVVGIDKNDNSLQKAILVAQELKRENIIFHNTSLENWPITQDADFVLLYGLLYHAENPIEMLRKVAKLARKTLCIETQVLPFDISGFVEDGNYSWQREIKGLFGLCIDYSERAEGGMTDLALIPSKNGLEFLLGQLDFKSVFFYVPEHSDYEQFVRGHRVIIFAEKE